MYKLSVDRSKQKIMQVQSQFRMVMERGQPFYTLEAPASFLRLSCISLISCTILVFVCQLLVFFFFPLLATDTAQLSLHPHRNDADAKPNSLGKRPPSNDVPVVEQKMKSGLWACAESNFLKLCRRLDMCYTVVGFDSARRKDLAVSFEVFFLALAVATLVCDAFFHLIPEAFLSSIRGPNSTPMQGEVNKSTILILGFSGLVGVALVFVVEMSIHSAESFQCVHWFFQQCTHRVLSAQRSSGSTSPHISGRSGSSGSVGLTSAVTQSSRATVAYQPLTKPDEGGGTPAELDESDEKGEQEGRHHYHHHHHHSTPHHGEAGHKCAQGFTHLFMIHEEENEGAECEGTPPSYKVKPAQEKRREKLRTAALTNLFAGVLHNIVDGLSIGVAFSGGSLPAGIATSFAVFFHEVPAQVANFIILQRGSYSPAAAYGLNVLAGFGLHLGAIITLAGTPQNLVYILQMVTGANFLCLGLCVLLPQVRDAIHDFQRNQLPSASTKYWGQTQSAIAGFAIGGLIVVGLSFVHDD